ncbi:unnamed protein product [Microthlaspi erraticum]|uniref:Retrotransposon gag domain-containing protein n=1 Tax=Microthlaspi erraticum TaxID=1685480 RepID=A0A6D2IMA7_9BRAS|nr:unnamed protein product [Microthlaspi erraticum]
MMSKIDTLSKNDLAVRRANDRPERHPKPDQRATELKEPQITENGNSEHHTKTAKRFVRRIRSARTSASSRASNSEHECLDQRNRAANATSSAPEIARVLKEAHNTPLSDEIVTTVIQPQGKLNIHSYDGQTNPARFLTAFHIDMKRYNFTPKEQNAAYCKLFVGKLTDAALQWFSKLEPNSIESYNQLTEAFIKHYWIQIREDVSVADLYSLHQGLKESMRSFIDRLTTLEDALHRASGYVELEEDKTAMTKKYASPKPVPGKDKPQEEYREPLQHYDDNYKHNYKKQEERSFGSLAARRSSRRPKVTILIWKDRYLSHASRRSGMKPFGSTMRPELIFYRDMSGKRANEAHGGFGVSNGPSSSAKGLDRIEKRPG